MSFADLEIPPIESIEAFEARVADDFKAPFRSKFGALFLDHLDDAGEEHEYIIDGLFSVGDRSIIGGPTQSGKSFLGVHAGMCVAHGIDFFGLKTQKGLVIYQIGEGRRGFRKRLRAWRKHHGVEFSRETPFVPLMSPIDIYHPEGDTKALIEEIKAIAVMFPDVPLRMIFIDTLATATSGAEENSGRDMGMVVKNIAQISGELGCHVCLIHHLNASGTKLRGHTSVPANVDQVILVTRNETTKVRTAVLDKQKDDESGATIQFELMSIEVGYDPWRDKPMTSCVCLPVGEKDAVRRAEESKGFRLNNDEVIFMRALFEAEKLHGQPVPAALNVSADVRSVILYDEVKRVYAALSPSDAVVVDWASAEDVELAAKRHREALKKRLQRMREALTKFNVIGAGSGYIWWTGKPLRAFPQTIPREAADDALSWLGSSEEIPF